MAILGIVFGGGLGALARYATAVWLQAALAGTAYAGFPLATLVVNVLGSFLLSVVVTLGLQGVISPAVRLAIGTGFLGALTTFSTFELEGYLLVRGGEGPQAVLYVLGNLVLGYLSIVIGRMFAMRLMGI